MSFTQSCSAGREQSLKLGTSKLISTGRLFLYSDRESWRRIGELLAELQIQGNSIPFQCAAIVALALQHNLPVLTRDQHFSRVCRIQLQPFN